MRLRLRPRSFAVALVALATLSVPILTAASPEAQAIQRRGTSIPPCAKAKLTKAGAGGMCDLVFVPKDKAAALVAKMNSTPTQEAALAAFVNAGDSGSGICHISGCYDLYGDHHSGYDAVGAYYWRYQSGAYQRIGIITIDIDDYTVSQYSTKIAPFCWSSTASTWATYHVIERYYATPSGANGKLLTRRGFESPGKTVTAAQGYKYCLPATGNKDFSGKTIGNTIADSTQAFGTVYHYVTWRSGQGFSGKWYAYIKSPIFYRINKTEWLHYYVPMRLPADPANADWLPN